MDIAIATDFGGVEGARDVIILPGPDQKMLVAGSNAMARYNSNGSLDTTFGTGGKVALIAPWQSITANAIALEYYRRS